MASLPEVYRGQPLATIFVSHLRQGAKLRWHLMGSLITCQMFLATLFQVASSFILRRLTPGIIACLPHQFVLLFLRMCFDNELGRQGLAKQG